MPRGGYCDGLRTEPFSWSPRSPTKAQIIPEGWKTLAKKMLKKKKKNYSRTGFEVSSGEKNTLGHSRSGA